MVTMLFRSKFCKADNPYMLRSYLVQQRLSPAAVDLLCNLLVLNPAKRLNAYEAFQVNSPLVSIGFRVRA